MSAERVTDGGRNMFFEGAFDGETVREKSARLAWANDMRAAFERHTGNGWFDKQWQHETALWAAAWRCKNAALSAADAARDGSASGAFAEWLAREMPPGTIISDPLWWAPRIERAIAALRQPVTAQQPAAAAAVADFAAAQKPFDPDVARIVQDGMNSGEIFEQTAAAVPDMAAFDVLLSTMEDAAAIASHGDHRERSQWRRYDNASQGLRALYAQALASNAGGSDAAGGHGDWQLVPKVPTEAMVEADLALDIWATPADSWAAMLSAAPSPQEAK